MQNSKDFVLDKIETKTLPDPKCEICWGTGKTKQRVSTNVPYRRPPKEEFDKLFEAQFIETECDCIVKQNVIKANKEVKSEKPKIIWNGRELSR